jgi:hypothetical protein
MNSSKTKVVEMELESSQFTKEEVLILKMIANDNKNILGDDGWECNFKRLSLVSIMIMIVSLFDFVTDITLSLSILEPHGCVDRTISNPPLISALAYSLIPMSVIGFLLSVIHRLNQRQQKFMIMRIVLEDYLGLFLSIYSLSNFRTNWIPIISTIFTVSSILVELARKIYQNQSTNSFLGSNRVLMHTISMIGLIIVVMVTIILFSLKNNEYTQLYSPTNEFVGACGQGSTSVILDGNVIYHNERFSGYYNFNGLTCQMNDLEKDGCVTTFEPSLNCSAVYDRICLFEGKLNM